ncbi:MAG: acyl-CoA dehydrogenase family protein [Pseudonocardia sp.]|nr:acyl-CoA dehydrogenase family protein [Pseudonocardia sp.]
MRIDSGTIEGGTGTDVEDVSAFRARAAEWLAATMPPAVPNRARGGDDSIAIWDRARELQRILHAGGFAGLVFPKQYGGQGLTVAHQRAFNELCGPYEMPLLLNVPSFTIMAATLLDFGTEEQKRRHIPAILRGDEVWVQFLSEPSGGSDLASARTRATRDGDHFVLNGAKVWSSAAFVADYAMILARTNWDVPKHRGLTMFIVQVHQPGITVNRIKQVDGSAEFCEEFFTDVVVPEADILGRENDGWTVATTLLAHEKNAVGGGSPYISGATALIERQDPIGELVELAGGPAALEDGHLAELVGEAIMLQEVRKHTIASVAARMARGEMQAPASAVLKLFDATSHMRTSDISVELAGSGAASNSGLAGRYLMRQARCLAGGSNEIQRNIISERVLGMPREAAADRDVPFRELGASRTSRA